MLPSIRRPTGLLALAFVAGAFVFSSCDNDEPTPITSAPTVEQMFPNGCDPISADFCGFPFPSNVWTVKDTTTPTGLHVHLHATAAQPAQVGDYYGDVHAFEASDGFSPGTELLAYFPNVALTGTAPVTDIAASVDPASKTIVMNAETGELVPHFVELDMHPADPAMRSLFIRPVTRLDDATRYLVAIRGLVDGAGAPIAPSPAFAALRDGTSFDHPSIEPRRELYADIFTRLASHGVSKDGLLLAWDFTTASRENNTKRMLAMRDRAFAALGSQPASYAITSVTDDPTNAHIARRIEGTVHVPLFLDTPGPGGVLVLGDDGLPQQNGFADYPFLLEIPRSAVSATATATPKPVLQYGHGLFGSRYEADDGHLESFSDGYGYVMLTLDWLGMSSEDYAAVASAVSTGEIASLATIPDRGQQAMLNQMVALDCVLRAIANDPQTMVVAGQPTIATANPRFYGQSLGGIYGSVYLTLSPVITRGVLLVPGQSFDFLLPRNGSTYPLFRKLLMAVFGDDRRLPLALAELAMLWDRVEPTGYTKYLRTAELPGTISHEVLMMDAIGDETVTTLGAGVMARAVGAPLVGPATRGVYGVAEVASPHTGSGFVEFPLGPTESTTNVPNDAAGDPHSSLSAESSPVARQMAADFLETGIVTNECTGTCDPF